jgi:hypothetical protein
MSIEYFCFHLNNCKKFFDPKTKQFFFINSDRCSIPVILVSVVQKKYGPIFTKNNIIEFESRFFNGEPKLLAFCIRTSPSLPVSVDSIADLHRTPINGDANCFVPQHERKIWSENLEQGDYFAYKGETIEANRSVLLFDKVDRKNVNFIVPENIFLLHKRFELPTYRIPLFSFLAVDFHFFRHEKAIEILKHLKITSIFDFGCGDGQFLRKLKGHVEDLSGYDLRKYFVEGVKTYSDEEYSLLKNKKIDCVTLIEVIEHFEEDEVSVLIDNLLGKFNPAYLLMSTPVKVESKSFTHPDHKFEWSRGEFEQFCLDRIKGYQIMQFETITNPVGKRQTQFLLMSRL